MKTDITENSHNNSHNNPALPVPIPMEKPVPARSHNPPTPPAVPVEPSSLHTARNLLPQAIRDRKFQALSFGSKLNTVQRSMLSAWLCSKMSIEEVRQKVAAPPPEGFGMEVCATTLRRLRELAENLNVTTRVSNAMDTACDML